jgi:hypothetical protein
MNKETFYRQCHLKRHDGWEQTSYIPEPFCVVGKVLKLRENDEWTDGWKVISAGERRSEEWVEIQSRLYLKTREVTDI